MTPVVAIDGPAASGKSSTAAAVARQLGFLHVDSGALYRGLTLVALEAGNTADPDVILEQARVRGLDFGPEHDRAAVMLDGRDADNRIRTPEVTASVSPVSALPPLRDWVNARLRALAAQGRPLVIDGRDIGTVVFPDAAVKVFLTATPQVRAQRRLLQQELVADPEMVRAEAARIAERDRADAERPVAPLRAAMDAVHLDTSAMGFGEQVERIVALVRGSSLRWMVRTG